ncbi:hypothetical protein L288_15550 [Sphingobium quisquiliarum P25]|uniref:TonB-denpendent receptor n=1 Tax=Sphingobium quisquiliarum P25 TaxID=1329909 RepID=T0GGL7_9SPHN|nr:TonB-dependent receptor [Sphingobium sp. DC-2]EQB02846.1 hypothetical protein L288_15550 [Sphingobium quisquiliarum P25]
MAQTAPDSAAAPESQSADSGLEDIIVTAQRRSENIQRVPIAITAVTADTIQSMGVRGTQDLSSISPGLYFGTQIGNASPFIRGVGTFAVSAGQESAVSVYVDGVYIASQSGSVFALNNIERVEILKGPQGTLFGRNATGGLIQVITKDPSHDTQVQGTIGYGNYDTTEAKIYASTGLTDTIAVDFAGSYTHQGDGWGKNVVTGRDVNKRPHDLSLRSKLLFTPGPDTRITLSGDYSYNRGDVGVTTRVREGAIAANGYRFTGGFWDSASDITPVLRNEAWGASLKVEQTFDFAKLVSISAFRKSEAKQFLDFDATPSPFLTISLNPRERQFSQELQLQSPESSAINWILGAFYYHGNSRYSPFELGLYPAASGAPGLIYDRILGHQVTNSYAAFAQATVPIGESTRVTAGIRYTKDHRRFDGSEQEILTFAPVSPPATVAATQRASEGKPTWRLSVAHDFAPGVMGYASYNRGFKSGVFNLQAPGSDPIKSEKIDAYEAGVKIDALDRHLRINISGFYSDYKNIQLQRNDDNGVLQLLNAASAKIYGADVEITAIPFEGLTLRGALGLLHSRYGDFPDARLTVPNRDPLTGALIGGNTQTTFNAKGNHTVQSPDYTANVSASYETSLGDGKLAANASYVLQGRTYAEVDNRTFIPGNGQLSADLSYTLPGDHYRVRVWGRNLTKEKVYQQLTEQAFADGAIALAPRTYGVAFDFTF